MMVSAGPVQQPEALENIINDWVLTLSAISGQWRSCVSWRTAPRIALAFIIPKT